ncbi:MAG: hypothetical protein ACI3XJ_09230 [Oscillospiraceae bacterium]
MPPWYRLLKRKKQNKGAHHAFVLLILSLAQVARGRNMEIDRMKEARQDLHLQNGYKTVTICLSSRDEYESGGQQDV